MLIDKDNGYKKALAALVNKIPELHTGVFGEKAQNIHYPDHGQTVGDIAVINEFGTDTVPERSFVRSFWDDNEKFIRDDLERRLAGTPLADLNWWEILEALGEEVDAGMRSHMRAIPPPLAPSTVARKGHDETLIDTHQLELGIGHKVVL